MVTYILVFLAGVEVGMAILSLMDDSKRAAFWFLLAAGFFGFAAITTLP